MTVPFNCSQHHCSLLSTLIMQHVRFCASQTTLLLAIASSNCQENYFTSYFKTTCFWACNTCLLYRVFKSLLSISVSQFMLCFWELTFFAKRKYLHTVLGFNSYIGTSAYVHACDITWIFLVAKGYPSKTIESPLHPFRNTNELLCHFTCYLTPSMVLIHTLKI